MTNTWDAVIIGGGVAGLSAAQMLGRSLRRTLVIDAGEPRNRFAAHMHGALGHDGRDPRELLEMGREEAGRYGVELSAASATRLDDEGARIRVIADDGEEHTARAVVIASGLRDRLPDVRGLADEWGRTVLHCPYCHGWEVAGGRLAVIATTPMAAHQAELVRQLSGDVTLFAGGIVDDEALARLRSRGVRVEEAPVVEMRREGQAVALVTSDGARHPIDAVFTAADPDLDLRFAESLSLARTDAPGAPLQVDMLGRTSHPRIFAAGNATAPYANVPVAMGAGAMAGAGANAALVTEDFDAAS